MISSGHIPNQPHSQGQLTSQDPNAEAAMQTAVELVNTQKRLGLSLTILDRNLNKIEAKFESMADLMRNTEFISHLSQKLYVSNNCENTWFRLTVRKGKLGDITFLVSLSINWVKIYNKGSKGFEAIVVGYSPGEGKVTAATAAVPGMDFTPERIHKHFQAVIGETANDTKEVGKLLCYVLSKYTRDPNPDSLEYFGKVQGFSKNKDGKTRFSPPRMLRDEVRPYLTESVRNRQFPVCDSTLLDEDLTPILKPLFAGQKEFQLLLLYRFASWFSSFFSKRDVYADQVLIAKPSSQLSVDTLVAMLKNTRYDSLDAPPIGPNIKPLKFDLETVNDGMVVSIDVFAADQVKKVEKGYDLLISDATGATNNSNGVHHGLVLLSKFANLYIPKEVCCVLEFDGVSTNYSPETFKNALRRLDANIVARVEYGCNNGDFVNILNTHIDDVKNNMPCALPRSKFNTYIILMTALRIYNEWYAPLFCQDMEQYIEEWLCSQEQEIQPLYDVICSDFGTILNQRIADGYFHLILKEETTTFDKGSRTIVVDKDERRIYVETADSYDIAKDEMTSIADTDSLTAALYSGGYLPHNPKEEKSVRIAAITSDGVPYPLYVHAIKYTLLTQENRQRFELIDKETFLFKYDEIPEGLLPLVKTIDGRFAGKMLRYEAEENNVYFGTGRIGSGKSWAIAQIIVMLFMLGHTVVVFDVSDSYTKEKLLRMLPPEVVEKLFKFINVGVGKDSIPIDLSSLRGCESLPDKKKAIYSVLRAATGSIDKSASRKLKGFLSDYLTDKEKSVDLNELCSELEKAGAFGVEIADRIESVLKDINAIGYEKKTWEDLFLQGRKIIVINLGNEVGDNNHQLLDMLVGSLFNWQMSHDSGFLSMAIDELIDQDFSTGSPLQTIVKQGRKFHTALIGATQDYFNQGSSYLDVMKQANIKSFCRPGKSEDRVAQKLGYNNAADAGFNKFKAGDTILDFDGYNKETGENEAITLKGRVVNFIETPLYEKFKELYGCY